MYNPPLKSHWRQQMSNDLQQKRQLFRPTRHGEWLAAHVTPERLTYLLEHRGRSCGSMLDGKKTSAHYANRRAGADVYAHAYVAHRKLIVMLCSCHVSIMRVEKKSLGAISVLQKMKPTKTFHYNTLYMLYSAIYNNLLCSLLWFFSFLTFFQLWPCLDMRFKRQASQDNENETFRKEKLNLYLTRKAKRREEQSRSRQEELQRNWANYGGLST